MVFLTLCCAGGVTSVQNVDSTVYLGVQKECSPSPFLWPLNIRVLYICVQCTGNYSGE